MEMLQSDKCGSCKYCYGIGISGGDGSVYNNYVCMKEKRHRVIMVDGPYSSYCVKRPSWCQGRQDGETVQISKEQQDLMIRLLFHIMFGNGWEGTYMDEILATPKSGAFRDKCGEPIREHSLTESLKYLVDIDGLEIPVLFVAGLIFTLWVIM